MNLPSERMCVSPPEIRTGSVEDAPMAARLTGSEMDRNFSNKATMLREVFHRLVWPFDIGTDIHLYRQSSHPMQLLRDVLWLQMKNCLDDSLQRKRIQLFLSSSSDVDLPADLRGKLEHISTLSIQRLTAVLNICYLRRGLRRGLTPIDVAIGIHAAGTGVLVEHTSHNSPALDRPFFWFITD